jgi:MOSC domain-containing protein YiiM
MTASVSPTLHALTRAFATHGRLDAILLRPGRDLPMQAMAEAQAVAGRGLSGDRHADRAPRSADGGKRQVTLIQAEHLPLIATWAGRASVDPVLLRRNLVISGLNLVAARSPLARHPLRLRIGASVILRLTGPCDPCSKMEAALGRGGYNAMRGHGGMTAMVEAGGRIALGDRVWVNADEDTDIREDPEPR